LRSKRKSTSSNVVENVPRGTLKAIAKVNEKWAYRKFGVKVRVVDAIS
jgi:hypothetical protein